MVQASKKITEKRLKWYGHVRRMKEEHIVRRMLDVDIPGKRRRGRPNLRWKDVCKRNMTQAGLKEDNETKRAEWRKKLISYTGDPKWREQYTLSLCITFIEQVLNDMLITGNFQQRCRQSQLLTDHVTVNLHYNNPCFVGYTGQHSYGFKWSDAVVR